MNSLTRWILNVLIYSMILYFFFIAMQFLFCLGVAGEDARQLGRLNALIATAIFAYIIVQDFKPSNP